MQKNYHRLSIVCGYCVVVGRLVRLNAVPDRISRAVVHVGQNPTDSMNDNNISILLLCYDSGGQLDTSRLAFSLFYDNVLPNESTTLISR